MMMAGVQPGVKDTCDSRCGSYNEAISPMINPPSHTPIIRSCLLCAYCLYSMQLVPIKSSPVRGILLSERRRCSPPSSRRLCLFGRRRFSAFHCRRSGTALPSAEHVARRSCYRIEWIGRIRTRCNFVRPAMPVLYAKAPRVSTRKPRSETTGCQRHAEMYYACEVQRSPRS